MHLTHASQHRGRFTWMILLALPWFAACGPSPAPERPQAEGGGPAESVAALPEEGPNDQVPSEAIATPDLVDQKVPVVPEAPAALTPVALPAATGPALYAQHCAACHSANGDGKGVAAAFLFPKPRDFRAGKFRLVSSASGIPSPADLDAVLQRGMPGSSMPPWPKLTADERKLLIAEVQRLHREGVSEQFIAEFKASEGEDAQVDPQELAAFVQNKTTASEPSAVPEFAAADEAGVARGKELYVKQGCVACHGTTGKGDGQQVMVDAEGLPTRPRDFTLGIFKGGHDPASVFRRIALGMPGTPMPSSANLSQQQVQDLTRFTLSLSTDEARQAAILNRSALTARRVAALPAAPSDAAWDSAPAATVRLTPLWWRDEADPTVKVQALHDGKSIAFRLNWQDATRNARAVGPDEFEDMAAVEVANAGREPFLGMGSSETPVDVWQWRAGLAETGAEDQLFDEYPFDTEEYKRLAKGKPLPDFVTARAAGNPLAKREHSGANQAAKGPGSMTFRPALSQVVNSRGEHREGRWTVVLTRPLNVKSEEGLPLASGRSYAAAFALWDGARHDRAAQKLISIWNDLTLE